MHIHGRSWLPGGAAAGDRRRGRERDDLARDALCAAERHAAAPCLCVLVLSFELSSCVSRDCRAPAGPNLAARDHRDRKVKFTGFTHNFPVDPAV